MCVCGKRTRISSRKSSKIAVWLFLFFFLSCCRNIGFISPARNLEFYLFLLIRQRVFCCFRLLCLTSSFLSWVYCFFRGFALKCMLFCFLFLFLFLVIVIGKVFLFVCIYNVFFFPTIRVKWKYLIVEYKAGVRLSVMR